MTPEGRLQLRRGFHLDRTMNERTVADIATPGP
jgi:hypothetical protein